MIPINKLLTVVGLLVLCIQSFGQRIERSINDAWTFTKEGVSETVNIPHSWNAHDTWDETPGYYRGICTYTKNVKINDDLTGKKIYVRFEGAYQECELKVNGISAGRHVGGFTAFIFDVTSSVRKGDNKFEIILDSSHNPDIPPLSADFTFYGGVYRDVNIVITEENHICNTHYASNGVYLTTPKVGETSTVEAKTLLDVKKGKYILSHTVYSPDGKTVAKFSKKYTVRKPDDRTVIAPIEVNNTRIWDIEHPDVYRVETVLSDKSGKILDRVSNPLGFRTWSFDVEKGFTMNGRQIRIAGTNRHQDYLDMGNALSDNMHERDIRLLKDLGGNFLRIAHYPQDPVVCQMCDRYGIVNSIEIPVVNAVTETEAFRRNCVEMAREMVCQNYNNPSVIIWTYMNEVLLKIPKDKKKGENLTAYYAFVRETAQAINNAIKELDPYRNTMLPCNSSYKIYKESGVGEVPDIIGWNFYKGWYSEKFEEFDAKIKKCHETFPDKPIVLSEFGAGVDSRLHSSKPERFDFSQDYGLEFHKYYYEAICRMPFIAGFTVWNLNDAYNESRVDAIPHVNKKGLVGLDRKLKDVYLFYQANLVKNPYLKIGGREWKLRGGNEGESFEVKVFTNQKGISLFCNGQKAGETVSDPQTGTASFIIRPVDGENVLVAKSESGLEDMTSFNYSAVPSDMSKFVSINVSLGSNLLLEDAVQGSVWIPEQEYRAGSWGYVGGTRYVRKNGKSFLTGTDADILGTAINPVFQTQRVGLESFKADVPDGDYYVYLYFSELSKNADAEERIFSVKIGDEVVLSDYNIKYELGCCRAGIKKFATSVRDGKGLCVDFIPVKGKTVLNAIRIYRCF